ncbi:hypothetical protein ABT025_27205 [Streptomyces sp. NPDC002809]|uniref:hypothetical protein n=1 Tax=Streptomyces sp. NPDC002809 TaxID=3154433 RepID=UPI00332E4FA2
MGEVVDADGVRDHGIEDAAVAEVPPRTVDDEEPRMRGPFFDGFEVVRPIGRPGF